MSEQWEQEMIYENERLQSRIKELEELAGYDDQLIKVQKLNSLHLQSRNDALYLKLEGHKGLLKAAQSRNELLEGALKDIDEICEKYHADPYHRGSMYLDIKQALAAVEDKCETS